MAKILVADDEVDLEILIKQKFRQKIREKQYEFVFAVNGKDALSKLRDNPDVDLVLSDINMPEMDGLTLLSKLNEQNPLIKAVIVSAYGDMENIRTAMNRGAFDFLTKPINFDDL
ncbi:MAG TPA: response regulator, partial [Chitinophagaceae bacterium]|nr:response regulator [Chitinophagaceae bacterium]